MTFKPNSMATAVGSFPHLNAGEACDLIFETIPNLPVWPQLPRRDFLEEINNQYSRGLPCYYIDRENKTYGFDTKRDLAGELERFYDRVLREDIDYFGLDENHSQGFTYFITALKKRNNHDLFSLKGQVIGPLTHGLVTDKRDGRYALYLPDLFDAIVKNSTMNARWQIRKMKEVFPHVILFIDEPSLSIIGSGYYAVDHDLVIASFQEIIQGIRSESGIPGMHCCGDADWDELLGLDLDIINFDAADDAIVNKFINSKKIIEYFERGKSVAWGIVPTLRDKIERATFEEIEEKFRSIIRMLSKAGLREDDLLAHSIITPSCGTGTLTTALAEKAMRLTRTLSDKLRGTAHD
jgi:hypothetical protein